jgi:diguanylate cyclase (GGDEF)-like protein/PAS domain S-box-containing protein
MTAALQPELETLRDPAVRAIFDAIPLPVFVQDHRGRVVFSNRACAEQFGHPDEGRGSAGDAAWVSPKPVADSQANDAKTFTAGRLTKDRETVWSAALGGDRVVHMLKNPVYGADGKPLLLMCASVDVTDQVKAAAELRAADEKLRRLYELSPIGIALTDMQGHYVEFNAAFMKITGYSREELNGLDYWALTPEEYAEQEAEQIEALRTRGSYGPFEKEYVRKDGSRVPLRLTGVLIQGSDGVPYVWSIVEDITEQKKKDALIWRQANFDMLTNLPNRRLFLDRLALEIRKAQRSLAPVAVLFIDLDHFKEINDAFGHDRGDMLLREAARRISASVRASDTVARVGGDEFAVILGEFGARANVERIAHKINRAVDAPFTLNGDQGQVSASVGIAIYPDDAADVDELLTRVDRAMYLAKSLGRNRFAYFTPSMQREADQKRLLNNDLRHALARKELRVHYQPIVGPGGAIVKAEALLRWQHPQRGNVPPSEFVPVAEGSGLIFEIGEWVLEQAIADGARLSKRLGRPLEICVNMSPLQFADSSRSDAWLRRLRGLPPNSLALEITESTLLKDSFTVKQRLLDLRNYGVQVSIDDFGIGFSALGSLKKFDIDYLKIDRVFTSGLLDDAGDSTLTEAIIVMARKLGIKTIAEGVETATQSEVLQRLGADYQQGFLFARAMPCEQLEVLLEDATGK